MSPEDVRRAVGLIVRADAGSGRLEVKLVADHLRSLHEAQQALLKAQIADVEAKLAELQNVHARCSRSEHLREKIRKATAIATVVDVEHGHRTEDTSLILSELADKILDALRE